MRITEADAKEAFKSLANKIGRDHANVGGLRVDSFGISGKTRLRVQQYKKQHYQDGDHVLPCRVAGYTDYSPREMYLAANLAYMVADDLTARAGAELPIDGTGGENSNGWSSYAAWRVYTQLTNDPDLYAEYKHVLSAIGQYNKSHHLVERREVARMIHNLINKANLFVQQSLEMAPLFLVGADWAQLTLRIYQDAEDLEVHDNAL